MNFLNSPEGQRVIALDYFGYPLALTQGELTPLQMMVIYKGRMDLHEKMNNPKSAKGSRRQSRGEWYGQY